MLERYLPEHSGSSEMAGAKGQSVVYLMEDTQPAAAFALADVIRKESHEAVRGCTRWALRSPC